MSILLLISILLFFLILNRRLGSLRAYALALVGFSFATFLFTELLSIFNSLNQQSLFICWLSLDSLLLCLLVRNFKKYPLGIKFKNLKLGCPYILIIGFVFFVTLITALVAAPSNYDAMIYYLTRVAHWSFNQNIDFYPTHQDWQNYHLPFAGFLVLQTYLLSGSDCFVNLVQWFAMTGSIALIVLIADCLKLSRQQKAFAALLAATLPMGVMQAVTTQQGHVLGFFVLATYYLTFCYFQEKQKSFLGVVVFSLVLGLALLTKATAYLYLTPVVLLIAISFFWQLIKSKDFNWSICLLMVIPVLINTPHWLRNYQAYDAILGPATNLGFSHVNEVFGVSTLVSNLVRNTAVLMISPVESFNVFLNDIALGIHQLFSLDINDPRTSWHESFGLSISQINETSSGNPIHFLLFIVCLIVYFFKSSKNRQLNFYLFGSATFFVLFCFYLKSQIFHARLFLPLMMLLMPLVAYVWKFKVETVSKYLLVCTLPYLFFIGGKSWIGEDNIFSVPREAQYFLRRKNIQDSYLKITQRLAELECKDLAFLPTKYELYGMHWLIWEYPLWQLMENPRIESINVVNSSREDDQQQILGFKPCAIFLAGRLAKPADSTIVYQNRAYHLDFDFSEARLYLPRT